MTQVLTFWRDVEIFNIPDVPKAGKPGRAPALEHPTGEEDEDAPPEAETTRQPKRVLHTFDAVANQGAPLLPWHDPRFHPVRDDPARLPDSYAHVVYLGVAPKQQFVEFILRTHGIAPTDDELYRPVTGRGWLAGFIVDQFGVPLEKTYVPASFGVGSQVLREGRSLDDVGWELQARSAGFDARMDERQQQLAQEDPDGAPYALAWDDLLAERRILLDSLGAVPTGLGPQIIVESVRLFRQKNGLLNPPPQAAGSLMNSFFLDDLTTLLQLGPTAYSAALAQYLGPDSAAVARVDLLNDNAALAAHAPPALIPAGRWVTAPHEHLALAQQAAVYQVFDRIGQAAGERSRGLMAVNGPPGTGKTTLLRDLIANVVVERATRISALDDPQALFTDHIVRINGGGDWQTEAPALRAGIVDGTEIVVASSNNAAVENISFELPFSCDRKAFPDAAYLPEAAALVAEKFELARRDPWGLLSGALGAKSRRTKLGDVLMGFEPAVKLDDEKTHPVKGEPSSLKPWLDLARREGGANRDTWQRRWNEAKQDFTLRLGVVAAARQELEAVHEAMKALPAIVARRNALVAQRDTQRMAHAALEAAGTAGSSARAAADKRDEAILDELAERSRQEETGCANCRERLAEARELHEPGWLARVLKKLFGLETPGWRAWKDAVQRARSALDAAEAALAATRAAWVNAEEERAARVRADDEVGSGREQAMREAVRRIADLEAALGDLAARQAVIEMRIAAIAAGDDAPCLPDAAFLALPRSEQHRLSLWVSTRLDRERSALFLAALRLHEATVMATATSWFKVLGVVRTLLVGQAPVIARSDLAILWQSLFFVVPVVSTTLASFGRLFQGMEQESLGWVLIDEAGQAPPAAVTGALWRARRAVVVGDPLQIEPVVTVPRKLVEQLGRKRGIDDAGLARWSPSIQSAQRLADRTMVLGAMVGDVWTGMPLRTHRRCMSPMFGIANRIAYDDQMVQATAEKSVEPDLFPSCWIDVGGPAEGKVVSAQISALNGILKTLLNDWPQVIDCKGDRQPASIYIISPFRDVAEACQDLVKRDAPLGRKFERRKLTVAAGTVHTFQGKEASIVFLVLGSAPGEPGAGSRAWAAATPNLLNVALTRAQQRFYVIGNYADWVSLRYFSELAETAGRLSRAVPVHDPATGLVSLAPAGEAAAPQVSTLFSLDQ